MPLAAALIEWRAVLGTPHVLDDPPSLHAVNTATFATSQRAVAILRPADASQVRECLRIAALHGQRLHPVSRGCNWGLGSRVPPDDGAVVLDLSRLDAIVDFDEAMAWVTVEPGVTFAQLYAFLKERRSRLFVNSIGSSPRASVLANALARGDGAGPYGDRWSHVCALEVQLSTGETIRTGYGRFAHTPLGPLHRHGVGPTLDGLFSQSSLGVVTRLTLWLAPLPHSIQAVRFSVATDERLPGLVDALRALTLEGTIRWPIGLWNHTRVLSTLEPRGDVPRQLQARGLVHRWHGLTALTGMTELQGRAHRERLVDVLGPAVDSWNIEERIGEARSGEELLLDSEPGFWFLQGIPHEESVRSVYWHKASSPPSGLDPDRDGCGVLWSCAAFPMEGAAVLAAMDAIHAVMSAHGFDPLIAAMGLQPRALHLAPLILWDRDAPGQDAAALACHAALRAAFERLGGLPYRLGTPPLDALPPSTDDHDAVMSRLRDALDPKHALGDR